MQLKVNDHARISHYLVFYMINAVQIATGILGFQRYISIHAGYDGWIAVILAGILFHILIWIMYKMLNRSKGDLISIHQELFGKWLGGALSIFFTFYFSLQAISILSSFAMIYRVWMFPDLSNWEFAFIYLILVYYAVSKGFRVIAGVCFFGVVLPSFLMITYIPPFFYGDFRHLLPLFTHSYQEILAATKQMTYSYLGIETLLIFYPFIKNPEKSQQWAHYGNLYTLFVYLVITISSFVYYSEEKLSHSIWATLTMWKIVSLPVVDRFEVIGLTIWILVVLPNMCLLVWSSGRIVKRVANIPQKIFLPIILIMLYIPICMMNDLETTKYVTDITGRIGFYLVYAYIPLLAILYLSYKKVRKPE